MIYIRKTREKRNSPKGENLSNFGFKNELILWILGIPLKLLRDVENLLDLSKKIAESQKREGEEKREEERRGEEEKGCWYTTRDEREGDEDLSGFADTHNPRPLWVLLQCDADTVVGHIALQIKPIVDPFRL